MLTCQYTFPEFHNLVLKGHEKEAGIDKNVNIVLRLCSNTYSFSRRQTVDCSNRINTFYRMYMLPKLLLASDEHEMQGVDFGE